jgi:hypothetical protein
MKKTVEAMANHFQKATKFAVDKAIADLKMARKEAIELGDAGKVEALDNQIDAHKMQASQIHQAAPAIPEEIKDWVGENKWFDTNKDMREFAIAFQDTHLKNNPGGDLAKSLEATTKAVKRAFPEEFENRKRSEHPAVEGEGTPRATGAKRYTVDRLSPEQKQVYRQMVTQHKVLSHDEYFKSLDQIGELK